MNAKSLTFLSQLEKSRSIFMLNDHMDIFIGFISIIPTIPYYYALMRRFRYLHIYLISKKDICYWHNITNSQFSINTFTWSSMVHIRCRFRKNWIQHKQNEHSDQLALKKLWAQSKRKTIIGPTFHLLDDHAALRSFSRRGRSRDHHLERRLTAHWRWRLLRGLAP
jgi:hypothetical protein